MRAAQLLVVTALGASALLLAFGMLWFFGLVPVPAEQGALPEPATCGQTLTVTSDRALNNALSAEASLSSGDRVCLVPAGPNGTVVYTMDGAVPGDQLFEISGSAGADDLAQLGLASQP